MHSAEEIQKHVRTYIIVFTCLLALTLITVGVSYLHLPIWGAVILALIVASVKGTLVGCFFMHLLTEKGMLFWILGLCALFFIVLMALPVITTHNFPLARFVDGVSGAPIGN